MNTIEPVQTDYFLDSASGAFVKSKTLSKLEDVSRILDKAAQQAPRNGLVLHFHGGLDSRQDALTNIVPQLTNVYQKAGAYPLFFVWESGLMETLLNNKGQLLTDPAFRELVKKVTEWTLKKITIGGEVMVRGAGGKPIDIDEFRKQYDQWFDAARPAPPVPDADTADPTAPALPPVTKGGPVNPTDLQQQIQDGIVLDPDFRQAMGEAYNAWVPASEMTTKGAQTGTAARAANLLLSEAALQEMFPAAVVTAPGTSTKGFFTWLGVAKFVAKVVLAVIARFRGDRDHGVYCTVVEEVLRGAYLDLLGTDIWNQMKNDTLESFQDGDFCGTAVVRQLKALQDGGKGFKKLTLVGHSTGAVYICNFLDSAKAAGLSFDEVKVIFLAPAVTCTRFAQAIEVHGNGYLKNFRMFAMHDERESSDVLVPILYTRSLLYFVSGVLEGQPMKAGWQGIVDMPLVGMERFFDAAHTKTFSDNSDVQKVLGFLTAADQPHRCVWSQSLGAGEGLNSDSGRHGDFDNDSDTLTSVSQLIGA